jgi:CRISPR-associated protein Csd1
MILNALYDYYQRLVDDPSAEIAPFGFSVQQIGFRVVIEPDGKLHAVEIMGYDDKGKPKPVPMTVPGQTKPSGAGLNPCFLWDNAAYLLGLVPVQKAKGKTGKALAKEQDRAKAAFEKLRDEHLAREKQIDDPAYSAVCRFLEKWDASQAAGRDDLLEAPNHNGIFQIRGQAGYVQDRPKVLDYWRTTLDTPAEDTKDAPMIGQCLVTGKEQVPIARLHEPKIKGIVGGQSVGGSLVSFNDKAYESFGYSQSYNAPVSEEATFRYCTALNSLLAQRNRRVIIGDATTVFWTDKPTPIESYWGPMLDARAEDEKTLQEAQDLLRLIANGKAPRNALGEPDTRFYVLGLSPNAARISVRYWFTGHLGQLLQRVQQHLQDLNIIGLDHTYHNDAAPPPMVRELLLETARDPKDIPPLLAGSLMSAILTGKRYPESFYLAVLRRIMTDGRISARRMAILKACINRHHRISRTTMEELPVALDIKRSDMPYVLGRLFACYEKIQKDGLGEKLNRTIKDSFLSSASSTPSAVFPRLFKLSQHHLGKIEFPGLRINREKLLADLYGRFEEFPNHLSHHEQGVFAIGYYHQLQDFYTSKADREAAEAASV